MSGRAGFEKERRVDRVCGVFSLVETLDGRLLVNKTEQKYEFKTDTKVGKVG